MAIVDQAKTVRITVVVENSVAFPFVPGTVPGMLGEHGLAVLIESDGCNILYDTGRGKTLIDNLDLAGIRPGAIDKVVISHGHLDHTGALLPFIQRNGKTEVYCHPDVFSERYGKRGSKLNNIGNPFSDEDLVKGGAKLILSDQPVALSPGIVLSGSVPVIHRWELDQNSFYKKKNEALILDDFVDDQSLFIRLPTGLVVVAGCSHAGIINILEWGLTLFGNVKLLALIGGLHLSGASPERMDRTLAHLERLGVEKLLVGHCTGFEAACRLWQEFGNRVALLNVGRQIVF